MDPALSLLTNPHLERFRAKVPYPLVVGLLALIMSSFYTAVYIVIKLAAPPPALAGKPFASDPTLYFGFGLALFFTLLYTFLATLGWLSGYRPFVHRWQDLTPQDSDRLFDSLATSAESQGFSIVWRRPGENLVAVKNMNLEKTQGANSGELFPMRLVIAFDRKDPFRHHARLSLSIRTVCVWDTGETKTCQSTAQAILDQAATI